MNISIKYLAVVAFSDRENEIYEKLRPKITTAQYLLGCGLPKHMTTTRSRVVIIQINFTLFMS